MIRVSICFQYSEYKKFVFVADIDLKKVVGYSYGNLVCACVMTVREVGNRDCVVRRCHVELLEDAFCVPLDG